MPLLILGYLIMAPDGGSAQRAVDSCVLPPASGQVAIQLASDTVRDTRELRPGSDASVVVYGVNPFMGAHRIAIGEDQPLQSTDPVELVATFVRWAIPALAAPAPLETAGGPRNFMPDTALADPCRQYADELHDLRLLIAVVAYRRAALEERVSGVDSVYGAWQKLRTRREVDLLVKNVNWIQQHGDSILNELRGDSAELHDLATNLQRDVERLRAAADSALGGPCADAYVESAEAEARSSRNTAAAVLALVSRHSTHVTQVSEVVDRLSLFPNECSQYRLVKPIPLKSKPTAVDVEVQMAPAGAEGDGAFRTIATRRIRFQDRVPVDVGIGIGAFWSSIPSVEYGTRDFTVPPPPDAPEDTVRTRVAIDNEADDRFVPAVVLTLSPPNLGWLKVVAGVGVNTDGQPSANYLLGGGFSLGPVTAVLAATAAQVEFLKDELRPGDLLPSEAHLRVGSGLRWGMALGLTLKLR